MEIPGFIVWFKGDDEHSACTCGTGEETTMFNTEQAANEFIAELCDVNGLQESQYEVRPAVLVTCRPMCYLPQAARAGCR